MSLSDRELDIPPDVDPEDDPIELIRFWVSGGEDHVNLLVGTCDPVENEPHMWGYILADIAKHAVRALRKDSPGFGSTEEVLAQIEAGFRERMGQNPDLTGQLQGRNH